MTVDRSIQPGGVYESSEHYNFARFRPDLVLFFARQFAGTQATIFKNV